MRTQQTEAYARLLAVADGMPVIDTHEHLPLQGSIFSETPDILSEYLLHYISSDLYAAGLSSADYKTIRDPDIDLTERWALLEPWLERVKNTSYYRALRIAMRELYGIDDMTGDTIGALQERFRQAVADPDYKRRILKDRCHIERSIVCQNADPSDPDEFFARTYYPEAYCVPWVEVKPKTLAEYCEEYKSEYRKWRVSGIAALKIAMAYDRSLAIGDVPFEEAEALFSAYDRKGRFPKRLQDYMLRYALRLADEDHFVVQFHTGLQEGMGNDIRNSDPYLLRPLFAQYPNLTFDLFHIGYPYDRELLTLAKYYPNVCVDMCWAHVISPHASREFFREALDVIPYTKIFAFGGDYLFFDGVYGHLAMAKRNICEVLAEKVERGEYGMALAEKILRAVFYDNAKRVFGL